MLEFRKQNGFPLDIRFETLQSGMWDGFVSDVYIEGKLIETFMHNSLRDRINYANRIFENEEEIKKYKNKNFVNDTEI